MGTRSIVKEEVIKAAEISDDRIQCPKCKQGDVTLYGYINIEQQACIERFEDGKSVDRKVSNARLIEFESAQLIERIDCYKCNLRFKVVQPAKDWERIAQMLSVQEQVALINQAARGPVH